jgi:hypothetical protein
MDPGALADLAVVARHLFPDPAPATEPASGLGS